MVNVRLLFIDLNFVIRNILRITMDLIFSCVFALGLIQYSSCIIYSEVSKELENTEIDFSHSLQENIKNCTPNSSSTITDRPIECQPKPRRKRYIAFPYGSSFSVSVCEKGPLKKFLSTDSIPFNRWLGVPL